MKIPFIAISISMFIFMTILGVVGYAYDLWSQYWHTALEKKQMILQHSALFEKSSFKSGVLDAVKVNNTNEVTVDILSSKIHTYKTQLLIQLRKAQLAAGSVLFHKNKEERNIYKVKFKRKTGKIQQKSQKELMCELKNVKFEMLHKNVQPFQKLGYDKYFPSKSLHESLQKHNTCAIVSSAGSMYKFKLGKEIDSHDIVLRFNSAPTDGYQEDVGTKTSIRFLNSQVVSKPKFDFLNSPLYQNITLIVWDPSKYHSSLEEIPKSRHVQSEMNKGSSTSRIRVALDGGLD